MTICHWKTQNKKSKVNEKVIGLSFGILVNKPNEPHDYVCLALQPYQMLLHNCNRIFSYFLQTLKI